MLFPTKLHFILEIVSKDPKLSDIVSWLPCGRAFKIHDPVAFANIVLPKYFVGMHSLRSFRRQLNIYGIKKLLNKSRCLSLFLDDGDDASEETAPRPTISPHASKDERQEELILGAYYHPLFQRGRKDLASKMIRSFTAKASSKGSRQSRKKAPQVLRNDVDHEPSSLNDMEEFDLVLDGIESILFDDSSSISTTITDDCSYCSQGDTHVMLMKELASCIFKSKKSREYLKPPRREASPNHQLASCDESSSSSLSPVLEQDHFIFEHFTEHQQSSLPPVDQEDIRREILKTFMCM